MKTVFSNSELVHIFAKQSQSEGRTSNQSMFFDENKIFSYGRHFCMANIIDPHNALINSDTYSVTTSQHLSKVGYALNHLTCWHVPCPEDINNTNNLDYCVNEFKKYLDLQSRARKTDYYSTLHTLKETLYFLMERTGNKGYTKQLKDMSKALDGMKKDPKEFFKEMKEEYKHKQKTLKLKLKKEVEDWKNNKRPHLPGNIKEAYLRVSDNSDIETSKGAKVSLEAGKLLWAMIKAKQDIKGHNIEGYTVISLNGTLKIGCHDIDIKEVNRFGNLLDTLK